MLITIKQLILKTWDLYLDNFKKLLNLLLILAGITMLGSIVDILIGRQFVGTILIAARVVSNAVFYCATLLLTVAFIFAINRLLTGGEVKVAEIIRLSLKKFPIALLVSLVTALIIVGGFILLVIPGILFMVWYSFTLYQTLLLNSDLEQSLRHSHNLSRHRFWPVLWRVVLPNAFWSLIVWLLAYSIISLTDRILGGGLLNASSSLTSPPLAIIILLNLITDVLSVLATPLVVGTGLVLYHNLKETSKV